MPKIQGKKYFFKKTFAIMSSTRGFGFKNINFGVFSQGQEVPKTILLNSVAKIAA